jgi:two-component system NtrC family sensor kinase
MQKRVLIIDDIQSVRSALRGYLSPPVSPADLVAQLIAKGTLSSAPRLHIDEASQGFEGVELARKAFDAGTPYDIAFIDMLMPPGIDGMETIRLIRKFDKEIEIVVCTALSAATADEIAEHNEGVKPLMIQKPLTPETDLASIMNAVKCRATGVA